MCRGLAPEIAEDGVEGATHPSSHVFGADNRSTEALQVEDLSRHSPNLIVVVERGHVDHAQNPTTGFASVLVGLLVARGRPVDTNREGL